MGTLAEALLTKDVVGSLWALFAVAVVGLTAIGMTVYAWYVNKKFYEACQKNNALDTYSKAPAGLPEGTVRSLLALFIVVAVFALLGLTIAPGVSDSRLGQFSAALLGVLGTVLGFYFGNRSASGAATALAAQTSQSALAQRDSAVGELKKGALGSVLDEVRGGVGVASTIAALLPGELGAKATKLTGMLQDGLQKVDALTGGGQVDEALGTARQIAGALGKDSPLGDLLSKAGGTLGAVLSTMGSAVPGIALALAVVGIVARLGAAAQKRWTAHVLSAPYTPALFSPSSVDANTALLLIKNSPILSRVFAPEVGQGNRAFVREFLQGALSETALDTLWGTYGSRFTDRDEFEAGLTEFQRGALKLEVMKDLVGMPDSVIAEAGGMDTLMAALEKVNENPNARADLDAVMLVANRLKADGKNPEDEFRKAAEAAKGTA